jgi:hypothetical protein
MHLRELERGLRTNKIWFAVSFSLQFSRMTVHSNAIPWPFKETVEFFEVFGWLSDFKRKEEE